MGCSASPFIIGFILVFSLVNARASSQDEVVFSMTVGECSLRVESNDRWHTLRLRTHHPKHKGCHIDKDSMLLALSEAFSEIASSKLEANYSSLFIGRLIDYPWLSQYLAVAAYRDVEWSAKKGKPVAIGINRYVSDVLSRKDLIAQIEPAFAKGAYRVIGATVEKVLVGGFGDVPLYQGERAPGRVPFDAQVWFTMQRL